MKRNPQSPEGISRRSVAESADSSSARSKGALHALQRHWVMLQLIPRHPGRIESTVLCQRLREAGYGVDLRSVQRDLHKLKAAFPLLSDNRRPTGWFFAGHAPLFQIPPLDPGRALALLALEQHPAVPAVLCDLLRPHFAAARTALCLGDDAGKPNAWFRVRSPAPRPQADHVAAMLLAWADALHHEHCLLANWGSSGPLSARHGEQEISPLSVVFHNEQCVLVFACNDQVTHSWLDQCHGLRPSAAPRRVPVGFDLDTYLAQHFKADLP